jgi:pimeloyl-ACP methyl ester carboxylesterase
MVKRSFYTLAFSALGGDGFSSTCIAGRRCLLNFDDKSDRTPMIVVGGMAQTIASWEPHIPPFSKNRSFMVYECVGQGLAPADLTNVSLPFQATQLRTVLDNAFPDHDQFDLVGFSLGARICMAYSVMYPSKVRKLHLTGVAVKPSEAGAVALESWNDMLKSGNLQGFSWSVLQTTFSPSFLSSNINRLSQWAKFISENNSPHNLLAILEQTRTLEDWSTLAMSKRTPGIRGCLVVGELDHMAPYDQAQQLTSNLGWTDPVVMERCGHAVPTEEPRLWQRHVLEFLDDHIE